jgi:MscS family membrane protein
LVSATIPETGYPAIDLVLQHPLIQAGLVVLASLLLAKLVDIALSAWVLRSTERRRLVVAQRVVDFLHRPVQVSVVLIGLWVATGLLALPIRFEHLTFSALKTVALVVWMVFAFRLTSHVLDHLSRREDSSRLVQPRTMALFQNAGRVVLAALALYLLFLAWNIDITAWVASAGIIGIAVAFAAKDTLANLFSGFFILVDAPYKVGDFIVLDSGERGRVTQIGLRSTRLLTRDDIEITLPNAVIANAKIVNESGGPWEKERVRVKVSVAYGSDIDRVREVLQEVATSHGDVCRDPAPRVRFRTFGDSGLDFELLAWIDEPVLRGRVVDALNSGVYKALGAAGLEIPYPKRDVYLHWAPGHGPGAASASLSTDEELGDDDAGNGVEKDPQELE